MTQSNRKSNWRRPVISLFTVLVVVVGVYAYGVWQVRKLNTEVEIPRAQSDMIASFSLADDCTFRSVGGQAVFFDMGSRHSFVSPKSLERLREIGHPFEQSKTLVYTTDPDGHYRFYTSKVRFDVFLPNPEMPDSVFWLRNVELLVSDNVVDNVIGMDILRLFVIEHINKTGEVRIYHNSVPEGYEPVSDIDVHDSPLGQMLAPSRRASISLVVNDDAPRDYFFDTGGRMRTIEIVQPTRKIHSATSIVTTDSLSGLQVQNHCRVAFGNRLKYATVVYCDSLHTDEYSVNPLLLFRQDIVLDLPNGKLLARNLNPR